jgi:hypothetical protein
VRNRDVPGSGWASRGEQPGILGAPLGRRTGGVWAIGEKFIEDEMVNEDLLSAMVKPVKA